VDGTLDEARGSLEREVSFWVVVSHRYCECADSALDVFEAVYGSCWYGIRDAQCRFRCELGSVSVLHGRLSNRTPFVRSNF
jgi:hypothetical protein